MLHVEFEPAALAQAIRTSGGVDWNVRFPSVNIYGGQKTGKRIAHALSRLIITPQLQRKLIAY